MAPEVLQAMSSRAVRLLLAEDHPLMREALHSRLLDFGIDVVATAADGPSCVQLYTEHRPDVVLSDVMLPGFSGIEATRRILDLDACARVLVFSAVDDDRAIRAAIDVGAVGYVLKSVDAEELFACLMEAYDGQRYIFDRNTAKKVIALSREQNQPVRLSKREREVLALMCTGVTSTEALAKSLVVTKDTAKTHVDRIITKLGVSDRAQAVVLAYREGLVETGYDPG
jgi:DNA-binding NarL/FixJ family response regulator